MRGNRLTRARALAGSCALALAAVAPLAAHKPITSKYSYNADVYPIFKARCGQCHVAGGAAPMSLLNYKEAIPWAESDPRRARRREDAAFIRGSVRAGGEGQIRDHAERARHDHHVGNGRNS